MKVAAGNASFYKQLPGWKKSAFTIVEEGQKSISFRADERDKDIELWSGGMKIRTRSPAAASFSQTVNMPTDLELRIPMQYFNRILINGDDQPSYYSVSEPTDEAYSGYKFYMLPDLTYVSNIEVVFNSVPEANDGDINGDGQVTIADVTKLVNIILGKE